MLAGMGEPKVGQAGSAGVITQSVDVIGSG
jgi:hypothetical protein